MVKSLTNLRIRVSAIAFTLKSCAQLSHIKEVFFFRSLEQFIDVWHCLYGTYIDYLYYKGRHLLHPTDVLQLEFRHKVMNQECKANGTCVKCGCTTTALQSAKKSCKGLCYPYWIEREKFEYLYTTVVYKYPTNPNNLETMRILKPFIVESKYKINNV